MRPSTLRRTTAAMLGVVLLAGACSSGDDSDGDGENKKPTPKPTPTTSTADYNKALASVAKPLNQGLTELTTAKDATALSTNSGKSKKVVDQAVKWLTDYRPPSKGKAEHTQLITTFKQISTELGQVQLSTASKKVCLPSAGLADFGKAEVFKQLPGLVQTFEAKGYTLPLTVPKLPTDKSTRLTNGAFVKKGSRSGRGELTIDNGTKSDAVISLSKGKKSEFTVYVRAGKKTVVKKINDGTYEIYYSTGSGWDSSAKSFGRDCNSRKFDKQSKFNTTSTTYSTFKIGLQTSAGGNATTQDVPPGDVPR